MEAAIALITLAAMEIVLGIDNIVFIAIITGKLPPHQQSSARRLGLGIALGMRVLLLLSLTWVMQLDSAVFRLSDAFSAVGIESGAEWIKGRSAAAERAAHAHAEAGAESDARAEGSHGVHFNDPDGISVKDMILFFGGLFLLAKSVWEIHHKVEGHGGHGGPTKHLSFGMVLFQIAMLDIIFSLDSVITAVGMAREIWIMITAVVIAIVVMMIFANPVSRFVEKHPTITMLALSFLILIGVLLMAEGLGQHINKGYIYFAMAFSLGVEFLNMRVRAAREKHAPAH